jgi:KUP system potassium uptake protein
MCSLVIWTLIVVATIKYVSFAMRMDNYGDGAITPAISVLSALEGLTITTPAVQPYILPCTVIILIALFAVQPMGAARIG